MHECSSPRMRLVIHLLHLAYGQLCIPLRRRQPLVSQQFLNSPQISSVFQHVGAKGMAQRVRMHVCREPACNGDGLHDAADRPGRQPSNATRALIDQ